MSNLKYKLEALLFSSARSMKVEELANLTKASPEEVRERLDELAKEYENRDSSITMIDEGDAFKLNVKSEHASVVQQVVSETELSKTLMETLAVIAFKYPIKQSDLIKIRTNKAYDHLRELEEAGYIIRQKFGRTKLIKLTPKFFDYFDLPADKLKEKFQDFSGIAKAIQDKESEVKSMKEEIKKKAIEAGKKEEVDLVDDKGHKKKLETYDKTESETEEESSEVKPYTDKVGELEVTDVPEKEEQVDSEGESSDETLEETSEEISEEPPEEAIGDVEEPSLESEDKPLEESSGEPLEEETDRGIKMTAKMGADVVEKIRGHVKGEESVTSEEAGGDMVSKSPEDVESDVDSKVEAMLHPKEETEQGVQEDFQQPPEELGEEQPAEEVKEKETIENVQGSIGDSQEEPKDLLEAAAEEEKKDKKDKNENISS